MTSSAPDRFVRLPTALLKALLRTRLSATQWRLIIWIVRQTLGWNRVWTPFSWYRIAKELNCDRAAVYRAGRSLLQHRLIVHRRRQLRVEWAEIAWDNREAASKTVAGEQLWMTREPTTKEQRKRLSLDNGSVVGKQRFSVERKTGVKTERQHRRRGGYVDNGRAAENDAVSELMNFYGALTGKPLSTEEAPHFYKRFHQSATVLLGACAGDLRNAKALLQQSLARKPET